MRYGTKLWLMGVVPPATIIVLVGLYSWSHAEWSPFGTLLGFYAAVLATCMGLARLDEWRRVRRRLRQRKHWLDSE